ncbi:MAG: hypothetical protein ABI602_01590 [Candidatus Saccharibacteria bacterium]
MAEPNRKSNPRQVFDVARPNKSRPSATAKPVIVTNRPLLHDPMVNASLADEPSATAPLVATLPSKLTIQPPSSSAEQTPPPEASTAIMTEAPLKESWPEGSSPINELVEQNRAEAAAADPEIVVDEPLIEPAEAADESTMSEPIPVESPPAPLKSGANPIVDAPKDGALVTDKDVADHEDDVDENKEKIQKLVLDKRYFLPINSQEKRRTERFVVLGIVLILLLAAAWLDIALDAGLVHIDGLKPLTHLFSN